MSAAVALYEPSLSDGVIEQLYDLLYSPRRDLWIQGVALNRCLPVPLRAQEPPEPFDWAYYKSLPLAAQMERLFDYYRGEDVGRTLSLMRNAVAPMFDTHLYIKNRGTGLTAVPFWTAV